jgi:hypothetical protein
VGELYEVVIALDEGDQAQEIEHLHPVRQCPGSSPTDRRRRSCHSFRVSIERFSRISSSPE